MPSQRYAIDVAILIKSVEENAQEVQLIQLLLQMNKMGKFLLLLVKNKQEGEHVALTCYE